MPSLTMPWIQLWEGAELAGNPPEPREGLQRTQSCDCEQQGWRGGKAIFICVRSCSAPLALPVSTLVPAFTLYFGPRRELISPVAERLHLTPKNQGHK